MELNVRIPWSESVDESKRLSKKICEWENSNEKSEGLIANIRFDFKDHLSFFCKYPDANDSGKEYDINLRLFCIFRQQLQSTIDGRNAAEDRVRDLENVLNTFRDILAGDRTITDEDRQKLCETTDLIRRHQEQTPMNQYRYSNLCPKTVFHFTDQVLSVAERQFGSQKTLIKTVMNESPLTEAMTIWMKKMTMRRIWVIWLPTSTSRPVVW